MNEEILRDLLTIFTQDDVHEETEFSIDGKTLNLNLDKEGNEIVLKLSFKEDEFEKYINELDQDIFVEACENFEDLTGEHLSNDVDHDLFKSVVNEVIRKKIDSLKKFLG